VFFDLHLYLALLKFFPIARLKHHSPYVDIVEVAGSNPAVFIEVEKHHKKGVRRSL
jgi:hypothetical protein